MSKPCEGIRLAPMKMVPVPVTGKPAVVVPKSSYVPPSKRTEVEKEVKTLSKEDLSSKDMFPTLAPMKPTTTGASWGQLRNRLAAPVPQVEKNFKATLEDRIERERKEVEEGVRLENLTDPLEMPPHILEQNGWATIRMPPATSPLAWHDSYMGRLSNRPYISEDDWFNARTEWTRMGISEDPPHCVYVGGDPYERTPSEEPDYFAKAAFSDEHATLTPIQPESERRARNNLLNFVGKKVSIQ